MLCYKGKVRPAAQMTGVKTMLVILRKGCEVAALDSWDISGCCKAEVYSWALCLDSEGGGAEQVQK